jgi:hypothetical protein
MRPKPLAIAAPLGVIFCIAAYFSVLIRPSLADDGLRSVWSNYDYQSYFLPRFVTGSKWLLQGRLPVWNPYEFSGIPFLASGQPAVFYPPKILLFGYLPPVTAHWVFLVVHYLLLAGTFLLFLKNRGLVGVPAFVGTAIWVFSTPMLTSNYHPNRIGSLAWMPLMFFLVDRFAAGTWKALAALSLVVAVMLTAGYPMLALDFGLLIAIHAVVCFACGEWKGAPWKTVPMIGAAFVLAAVAVAAQLLPLAELGGIAERTDFAGASNATEIPDLPRPLLSMIPALLAFVLVGIPLKRARPAAANLFACAFLAGGGWKLLHVLPGFSMSRFPFTWGFLTTFFAAWTAAIGCDALMRDELSGRNRRLAFGVLVTTSAVLAVAYVAAGVDPHRYLSYFRWLSRFKHNVNGRGAAVLGVAACASLIAIAVRSLRKPVPWQGWIAASLLAAMAHLTATPFAALTAPFARPTRTGIVDQLYAHEHELRGRALSLYDLRFGYEITDAMPSALGVEVSFLPARYRKIVDRLGLFVPYETMLWKSAVTAAGFLDAMDVDLVVVPDGSAQLFADRGYVRLRHSKPNSLMRSRSRIGRAWVNYAVHRVATENDALDYILGDRFDPHREVVVEGSFAQGFPEGTEESVTVAREREGHDPEHTAYEVELTRPGIFVVSESAYPGWEATVDGKPTKWTTADYVLRAIELGPGHHVVEFDYRPRSVRFGLWISALGLCGILALFWTRFSLPWAAVSKPDSE